MTMALGRSNRILGANPKVAISNIFIVANAFVWYASFSNFLGDFADSISVAGASFIGVGISAFAGTFLISKYQRRLSFIRYWILAGIPLSLTPLAINPGNSEILIIISAVVGVYFGIGLPVCMGYFAANTETGNRARTGGLIVLFIGIGSFVLTGLGGTIASLMALVLVSWRAMGLVFLLILKPKEMQIEQNHNVSFRKVISNRFFLLYFVPWIMFTLINDLTFPVYNQSFPEQLIYTATIVESILAGMFAVVYGFFADWTGRKRLTLLGFALLGLGYGALGFSYGNQLVFWFYTAVDGIAWGALSMVFIMTVWGDLAQGKGSEKFYVLGSLPYLLSNFSRLTLGSYLVNNVSQFALFSFASFFLFVAVLPLFLAPETLPEKDKKKRELKIYVEKAQQIAQKYY